MASERWEHFSHVADIGVRGYGATRERAFEQAALAMTAVITDPAGVAPKEAVEIACEAPEEEMLLAEWLNALIYEMSTRKVVFCRYKVEIHEGRLKGTAWGEPVNPARHKPAVEVKGATYTELNVSETKDGMWIAQCVVDV